MADRPGRRIGGIILISLAIILILSSVPGLPLNDGARAADRAPDFTVTDTEGNNWTLSELRGDKVVLLDLMAISCESCKIVEKNLKAIYADYKEDVFFISVDVWSHIDTEEDLRDYRADHEVPWPMALDTDDLLTKYSADNIAKIVIIDLDGYAVFSNTGVTSEEVMEEELDKALKGESDPIDINQVSLWALAVFAGVASFFSPCAFPMFPGYMTFYFKKHLERKEEKLNVGRAAASGTVAALGIIIVYVLIGALIIALGTVIVPYVSALQLIIGILLLFLGALMMTNIQYDRIIQPFSKALKRIRGGGKGQETEGGEKEDKGFYTGLFAYGTGYGGAAAACTLPVFLGVILSGIATGSLLTGLLLLLVYTIIAALLMIVVTVAIAIVGHSAVQKMANYTTAIKKISGLVLLLVGVYLVLFWLSAAGYITIPGLS